MSEELVHQECERGIATLTLDSPHNRNALSTQLITELGDALCAAQDDSSVRAVVITHTGSTFCAGADLSEARGSDTTSSGRRMLSLLRTIVTSPRPVVARVDGHARAGGLGLIGACDIVVAGPQSTFAFTEARLGLAPAIISLTTLPRLHDRGAGRYYLTGEVFHAPEAARIGLITEAPDNLDSTLKVVLDALRAGSPQGLAETKSLTTTDVLQRLDTDADAVITQSARLFSSDEAREGMQSLLQRRPPRWVS